jgi:sialidase-1
VRTQLGEIYTSYSTDRGETWSAAEPWGVRSPEAPATLRRIPATGDLLLIWNPRYDANAGHGGRRTPLVAAISQDEGRTWNAPRILEERSDQQYAYTSVAFVEDRVLLSYYVDDDATARISARFRSLPLSWFYEPETKELAE